MQNVENKYFIDQDKYNCPFCQNRGMKYVVTGVVEFNEAKDKKMHAVFVECSNCHNVSMHLIKNPNLRKSKNYLILSPHSNEYVAYSKKGKYDINDNLSEFTSWTEKGGTEHHVLCQDETIIMSIPTSFFTIDKRIPKKLRDLVNEAEKCIQNNCLTGASACVRKAIYEFLIAENAAGGSYEEKMKSLKGKYKTVDDDHIDILVSMQGIMCDQVHESSIHESYKSMEAKAYIELLKEIFNQVYVVPDELKAKKSQINDLFGSLKRKD